ncbi:hypothetical protein ACOQFV_09840 [Nocardiopsis changdeensis]|uniref:Uncharacterized protein n=1 Tax=Nocardiopsis changdeensis TaxID=2831969 RepID=A0ABX8BT62_9ACTN|nr:MULTISPECIES: hypothetical protein [Nocardiopsis]QUX25269.1 hypothetical protein KGD84_14035 [Nocardiopsis changdeensis]QYX35656.1 hypothetical protein K1J57_23490 [Nocardiopsis sp. MT53]
MSHDLERRRERIKMMQQMIHSSSRQLKRIGSPPGGHVKIRTEFIWLKTQIDEPSSDRRIPDKSKRPSATKIMTPRGVALKFYLICLFEAQAKGTAVGRAPINSLPLAGTNKDPGWTDLIALPAKEQTQGRVYQSLTDKKIRSLQSALKHLSAQNVQLVNLPYENSRSGRFERFQLLQEGGTQIGPHIPPYTVPRTGEDHIKLPIEFFTQGWIYLLEDSEISFLLMMFHQKEIFGKSDGIKVESYVRLHYYGMGRDSYSAHRTLERLGLISVDSSPDRDEKGRARPFDPNFLPPLHQFTIKENALSREATKVAMDSFKSELKI